ncbi:MAG TPA: hypothetical protein PLG31_15050 [Spirochaetota bacterium]|nr:hypothetical protein [Spirochaetota bacterium]
MKRIASIAAIIILSAVATGAHPHYRTYTNSPFNYKIIVPSDWERVVLNLSKKHIMYASKSATIEIKVRAFRGDDVRFDNIVHDERWDLRKIDAHLNSIIETGNITIKKNVKGKLFVFEYTMHRTRMIQRTMITKNADTVYIIECRAPRKTFYTYEKIFTTALGSFANLEVEKTRSDDNLDDLEDEKTERKGGKKSSSSDDVLEADDERI